MIFIESRYMPETMPGRIRKESTVVKTWVTEFSATTQRERCKGHCPQDVKEDGWWDRWTLHVRESREGVSSSDLARARRGASGYGWEERYSKPESDGRDYLEAQKRGADGRRWEGLFGKSLAFEKGKPWMRLEWTPHRKVSWMQAKQTR